jgi:mannan endo-1,4-beta-mannosidase
VKALTVAISVLLLLSMVSVTRAKVCSSSALIVGANADNSMYSFEADANGWQPQTYGDSQAITSITQDTTKAYLGNGSIRATVNLIAGDPSKSKGEAWVNMTTNPPPNALTPPPYDLSNAAVTVAVWLPSSAAGASSAPNGIQIFFKDNTSASKYSHWMNIGTDIPTYEWYHISIRMANEMWSWDGGANLTRIAAVGVKIGTNTASGGQGFTGNIWLDSFNWSAPSAPVLTGFVTVLGDRLALGGRTFYYNGMNQYYLFYESHKMVDEVIQDAAAMGLTVIRTWGFCDGVLENGYCFQPKPGVYDENTFEQMDYIVYKARQCGIRLVLPLVNNWDDMGGMNQYVKWSPTASSHDDFYTDQWCKNTFKAYINCFLNRVNNYTGVAYKDDPTIMIWELANEPRCQSDPSGVTLQKWIDEMASYIKSIDPNHLVSTGEEGFYSGGNGWMYDGSQGTNYITNHESRYVDVCSFHLYPDTWGISQAQCLTWIEEHVKDAHEAMGKPVYLGEFGWQVNRSAADVEQQTEKRNQVYTDWYNKLNETDADGAMFWLLSGHLDNGTLYPDYDHFTVYYAIDNATCVIIQNYSYIVIAKSGLEILPAITLTPNEGFATTMISGKYFPTAGLTITITWEGIEKPLPTVPTDVTTDNSGEFTAIISIPTVTPADYTVTATDAKGISASATFTVENITGPERSGGATEEPLPTAVLWASLIMALIALIVALYVLVKAKY